MEQQRFPVEDGAVTCRPVGDRLEVQAALPGPGEGLYRAYLRGESGKQLDLGTLLPQGNGRRLQRSLPIAELKRRGCWPVTGAGVTLSYAFQRPQAQGMNQPPKGWHKSEQASPRFPNRRQARSRNPPKIRKPMRRAGRTRRFVVLHLRRKGASPKDRSFHEVRKHPGSLRWIRFR